MMTVDGMAAPPTRGRVMRREARYYDLLVWLLTRGRERAFRDRLLDLARLAPGERVLDIGCGTGTLAIAARRRAGPAGAACGVDASPEMIARAARKARKAGLDVDFRVAVAEALPFPDAHFDVVLATLMLHHLPRATREQCVREMRRVLEPGGRALAVDFGKAAERHGLIGHLHRRHGGIDFGDLVGMLGDAGLRVAEQGRVGTLNLQFALATA